MIRIGVIGGIGSGKSFISKLFKSPVFNADREVELLYKNNLECYKRLKNKLPRFVKSLPISNLELGNQVSCIIDSSEAKQGNFAPGSGLPIVHPDILYDGQIKRVLVIAAGYNEEVVSFLKARFSNEIIIAKLDKGVVSNVKI